MARSGMWPGVALQHTSRDACKSKEEQKKRWSMYMHLVQHLPRTQNIAGSSPARGSSSFSLEKKELSLGVVACICLVSITDHTCNILVLKLAQHEANETRHAEVTVHSVLVLMCSFNGCLSTSLISCM